MSGDILGTSWDQCRSMVQYNFTSTETRRLVRTDSSGRPPRLSHSSWTMSIHVSGSDLLTFSFRFLFLFDWVGVLWPQLSKVLKPVRWPAASQVSVLNTMFTYLQRPFSPQCPCRGRLFVCCCGRCSWVHLRREPVSSYFSMACYSIVSYWCKYVCL